MPGRSPSIAIVGASARAAAFSALRAGMVPLTADLFADADLTQRVRAERIERYPAGLADWLRTTPSGTPWMYTGALENHADLVDQMAAVRPLLGCSGSVLRNVRDPLRLAAALAGAEVPFPETQVHSKTPVQSTPSITEDWLLKAYRGSSGSGVRIWNGKSVSRSPDPIYLQRRIEGPAGSAVYLIDSGKARLLGVTRQLVGTGWTRAAAFQYAGSIGPWELDRAAEKILQRTGHVLADFGVVGLCGVDFVLCRQIRLPYAIEVNPRYTASMEIVERLTGMPLLAEHVRAASRRDPLLLDLCPPHLCRGTGNAVQISSFTGKAILFAPRPIRVQLPFVAWALGLAAQLEGPVLADVPHAGTEIPPGRPVLTVFASGDSHADVEQRLQRQMEDVRRRLW